MPAFQYKAIDANGKSVSGTLEATDRRGVLRRLQSMQVRPVRVDELKDRKQSLSRDPDEAFSPDSAAPPVDPPQRRIRLNLQSNEALGLNFLKRLLDLHSSGMPLGDSVRLLNQRITDPQLKELAQALWRELSEGRPLAEALRTQPKVFSESITYVIEAGEATGRLVPILERIVAHLEEKREIQRNLIRGISYPLFLVAAALSVAAFLVFYLLPRVRRILASLGGEMNWAMWVLIEGSNFLLKFGPFLLLALAILLVAAFQWRRTPKGRLSSDGLLLRIPLLGRIFLHSELFQMTSLVGTLVGSDINMTETLRLTERTIRNRALRIRFRLARTQVNEGLSLSQAFSRNRIMPPLSLDILSVGENTGNIAHSLNEISLQFRRDLDNRLRLMTTAITSGAMILAFLLVALVAFGMVTSIFQVSKSL